MLSRGDAVTAVLAFIPIRFTKGAELVGDKCEEIYCKELTYAIVGVGKAGPKSARQGIRNSRM